MGTMYPFEIPRWIVSIHVRIDNERQYAYSKKYNPLITVVVLPVRHLQQMVESGSLV